MSEFGRKMRWNEKIITKFLGEFREESNSGMGKLLQFWVDSEIMKETDNYQKLGQEENGRENQRNHFQHFEPNWAVVIVKIIYQSEKNDAILRIQK